MKVFVVIDTDAGRLQQNMKILGDYGKVFDARSMPEMMQIREREGHIDAIFFSTKVPNIKDTILKIKTSLRNENSKAAVFLVGDMNPDVLADLFDAGVQDITSHPINPIEVGLNRKLPSLYEDSEQQIKVNFNATQPTRERIIMVCSPKGGEGKTTTATQIGAVLAKLSKQAILIDADYAGNAYRKLGIKAMTHSIVEFEQDDTRHLDRQSLEDKLVEHKDSGLKVLPSPWNEHTNVPATMAENALLAYKRFYSNIVIDTHQGKTPTIDLLHDYATDVVFVCRPDEDQLERTMEMILWIYSLVGEKLIVVVNMVETAAELQPIRVAMKEFQISATLVSLPLSDKDVRKQNKMLAVFLDPRKSEYAKAMRSFLKEELGIGGTVAASSQPAPAVASSSGSAAAAAAAEEKKRAPGLLSKLGFGRSSES
ncbi:CpaE family protein [Cohnella sp. GCM10020058]|uniref:AAA family ATPase n=1 Tax=Cohnella sp. GCM10020058 TaxID=3317330 RepID=UPI00362CEF27